jgi:hypothetical protein
MRSSYDTLLVHCGICIGILQFTSREESKCGFQTTLYYRFLFTGLPFPPFVLALLRIQAILIRIPDPAFQSDRDPDPYRFKEVMYLKQYFLYIFT